ACFTSVGSAASPGSQPNRRFRFEQASSERAVFRSRSFQDRLAPARSLRCDRTAAESGGSGGVSGGHRSAGLRKNGRSSASLAKVRRAVGALLAGCGGLCRRGRKKGTASPPAFRLSIPRL